MSPPVTATRGKTSCMHAKAETTKNFGLIYRLKFRPERLKNKPALSHEGCYQSAGHIPSTPVR